MSAERSAANSGGLAMPGQWERHKTVPGAGDPSTTTEGAPARSLVGDEAEVGGARTHAAERRGARVAGQPLMPAQSPLT